MSFLTDMLSKLPDMFKKTPDSTIGKLFTIVSDQMDDLQQTLDKMELWRDIDEAEGVVLDRLGVEILQEPRGGVSDEEYRLKLKTRIIVNYLSDGDIETIIKLLEVYLGDHLVSVQTAANVKEGPFAGEPATLLITINGHDTYGIPFEELAKVLTGGVGTQWQYLLERLTTIQNDYERWLYPFEYFAGELVACGEKVSNDNRLYASNFELDDSYSKAMNTFPICGDFPDPFPNELRTYPSNFELSSSFITAMQPYPICGEFVAGEVI
ncbi:hypothetical protein A3Q35_13150 [Aeribacillus pallidus]|uniref:hypothetical protein n=1 Tax=Aeribacillus pallidus TaxID=33936 RepID=UPI0007B4F30B|nr:hypothetical protein [Aeribacillus pallidus]KZM54900.1 hypothetical protein A3Q35_13150 [Aeribacillus pallidus]